VPLLRCARFRRSLLHDLYGADENWFAGFVVERSPQIPMVSRQLPAGSRRRVLRFCLSRGLGHGFTSTSAPCTGSVLLVSTPPNCGFSGSPNKALHGIWERGRSPLCAPRHLEQNKKGEQKMYMNQLTIIGFIGQDAEFHYTPNSTAITTLSVATKESWKDD
jgi:hypothetical protein